MLDVSSASPPVVPNVHQKIGIDDRRLKMNNDQLVDFVGMVANLKQGGVHQKSGEYKTGWHIIRDTLRERYNMDYSIDHLRAQWHLRLKVTRRKFYSIIDYLSDNGVPVNEENLDKEMLKKGSLCKPCDAIVYEHFKKSWMELKLRKDQEDLQFAELLAGERDEGRAAKEESTSSNDVQISVEVKEEPNEASSSLQQFLSTLPPVPNEGVSFIDQSNILEKTLRQLTSTRNSSPVEPAISPPISKRRKVEENNSKTNNDTLSSIELHLRDIASSSNRQAAAMEGIFSLLKTFVNK